MCSSCQYPVPKGAALKQAVYVKQMDGALLFCEEAQWRAQATQWHEGCQTNLSVSAAAANWVGAEAGRARGTRRREYCRLKHLDRRFTINKTAAIRPNLRQVNAKQSSVVADRDNPPALMLKCL